jgi:RNA polymerase sigma-70 factor (ECF subfamily)
MPDIAAPEVVMAAHLASARAGDQDAFGTLAEPYRRELQIHCYRMLGSLQEAEELVQETLLRAWQRLNTYEGRASFRAWLYKIATNACLDALDQRPRRTLPPARQGAADPHEPLAPPITEPIWLEPFPDDLLADSDAGPEARYDAHESITFAFLAALQALPPRQRAVLILRDVLDWHASEVADVLGLTLSSANSALHRARTTLAKHYHSRSVDAVKATSLDEATRALLDRYVRAWEMADIDALISLLKEDATFPMPPSPTWYQGRSPIRAFISSVIFAGDARGRWRLRPTRANGRPAFAWYQRDESRGVYQAFAIQVVTFDGDLIADVTTFPIPAIFSFFNVPQELGA